VVNSDSGAFGMDGDIKVKNRHFSLPHPDSMPSRRFCRSFRWTSS